MKFTRKFLYYPGLLLLVILVIFVIIFVHDKSASYEGKIYSTVGSEVVIERGESGIPIIKANSLSDAYFSIGFLHGQDRLALVEYFRAIARGRITELVGDEGIFLDKLSLILGFAREATNILDKLKSPYKDYIDSYVKGLNASKEHYHGNNVFKNLASPEFKAEDIISILLLFEWTDSFLNNKELLFPMPDKLAGKAIKDIIPNTLTFYYSDEERNNISLLLKIKKLLKRWVGPFQNGFAFYVKGENMEDGKSVSGFTLDSPMSVYPKLYPVSIFFEKNKIDGVTVSGLPFVFFGKNNDISFFGFNLNIDTQDFHLTKTRIINNIKQYYRHGIWRNFQVVDEKLIPYKQKIDEEVKISARSTNIGPVLSDLNDKIEDDSCLSINSILPNESYINTLFEIPLAESIVKAKRLVWNIYSFPKIYLFTSTSKAEYIYSGKFIQRNTVKLFHKEYAGTIADISGYGKAVTANNIIVGNNIFENEPLIIRNSVVFKDTYRFNNFIKQINGRNLLSTKDIADVLNSTYSSIAEKFTLLLLPILNQVPLPSAKLCKIYFTNWDFKMDPDSVAATIFNTLLINFVEETVNDEMENSSQYLMENYYYVIDKFYDMLVAGKSPLFDDTNTKESVELKDNIFDRALMKTLRYLNKQNGPIMEKWKWGSLHKRHFSIPLGKESFFKRRERNLPPVEIPGDNSTLNKGDISAIRMLKPGNISVMSGLFFLDLHLSFFALSVSPSIDINSEYFRNYSKLSGFINIETAETVYKFHLLPYKK